MIPALLLPVGIFSFLTGMALGTSRKNLSMLPPPKMSRLGVPVISWQKFIAVMAIAPRSHVSPRRRLGLFGLDGRRLSDVGFMMNPRKISMGSEGGAWTGEWVAPLTEEKFLTSVPAQYEAFGRSMRLLVPRAAPHVGAMIDSKKATLSGLLAVGHLAGTAGLDSWAKDPSVRQKFGFTTKNFEKANGIF